MNYSVIATRLGLALVGAAALIGATSAARAEGRTGTPLAQVEGLVLSATDVTASAPGSLVIHPAVGSDVTLTITPTTHFRKAGGVADTPDEVSGSLAPTTPKSPSVTWFVGLFARASYDPTSMNAFDVALSRPDTQVVNGVIDSATATDLTVNVKNRGDFHFTLGTGASVRLNGLASSGDKLVTGDLAEVLFWETAGDNEALRVSVHSPPPQHFEGSVSLPAVQDGSFTLTRGSSMTFQTDSNTQFMVNGKPGTFADLQNGEFASVYYVSQGGANLALGVLISKPQPLPPTKGTGDHQTGPGSGTGGDKGSGDNQPPPSNGTGDGKGKPKGTSDGGSTSHNPPGDSSSGKPPVTRPLVFQGQVAAFSSTNNTLSVKRGAKTMTFTVGSQTTFQSQDKPASLTDAQLGENVVVVYTNVPNAGTALKVYFLKPGTASSGDGSVRK